MCWDRPLFRLTPFQRIIVGGLERSRAGPTASRPPETDGTAKSKNLRIVRMFFGGKRMWLFAWMRPFKHDLSGAAGQVCLGRHIFHSWSVWALSMEYSGISYSGIVSKLYSCNHVYIYNILSVATGIVLSTRSFHCGSEHGIAQGP